MELQISNAHILNKENSFTCNFQQFNYLAITKECADFLLKVKTKNFLKTRELFIKEPMELFAHVLVVLIM